MYYFIHSFTHPLNHTSMHPFTHSFTYSLNHSCILPLATQSCFHLTIHSFADLLISSCIYVYTQSVLSALCNTSMPTCFGNLSVPQGSNLLQHFLPRGRILVQRTEKKKLHLLGSNQRQANHPAAKLHQAAECMLQELQPDKIDLQQACQLIDAKASALAKEGQGSTADQQLQGTSDDGLHDLHESKLAAHDSDKQFSKAESKAGSKVGSQSVPSKGKKQSQSHDATKGTKDKTKASSTKAGKPAVRKGTAGDKKPKTVGADKVSSKGTSTSPPKSRYRLFWRQQWAKLRIDHPSITMTDVATSFTQTGSCSCTTTHCCKTATGTTATGTTATGTTATGTTASGARVIAMFKLASPDHPSKQASQQCVHERKSE